MRHSLRIVQWPLAQGPLAGRLRLSTAEGQKKHQDEIRPKVRGVTRHTTPEKNCVDLGPQMKPFLFSDRKPGDLYVVEARDWSVSIFVLGRSLRLKLPRSCT